MGRKSNVQKAAEAEAARLEALENGEEVQEEITEVVKPKRRGRKPKAETESAVSEPAATDEESSDEEETAEPKKRVRKPKGPEVKMPPDANGDALPSLSKFGLWSDERYVDVAELPVIKERMKIEIQLVSPSLGMSPSDPDALKYVAKKPDEMNPADGTEEERTTTIWPKAFFIPGKEEGRWTLVNEPGCPQVDLDDPRLVSLPYIFDYQLRGMFKDSCGLLSRSKNNNSAELKSYKKRIDGNIFVAERKVAFNMPDTYLDSKGVVKHTYNENGSLNLMVRPIRISGPTGERSAISISEIVPPFSTIKFEVLLTDKSLKKVVAEWLDYGLLHGIGQWRNSGIGIFRWRELGDDWNPITE